jgi:hypothetical protein
MFLRGNLRGISLSSRGSPVLRKPPDHQDTPTEDRGWGVAPEKRGRWKCSRSVRESASHGSSEAVNLWGEGHHFVRLFPGFTRWDQEGESWEPSKKIMVAVASFKFLVRTSQKTPIDVAGIYNTAVNTRQRGNDSQSLLVIKQ